MNVNTSVYNKVQTIGNIQEQDHQYPTEEKERKKPQQISFYWGQNWKQKANDFHPTLKIYGYISDHGALFKHYWAPENGGTLEWL